MIKLLDNQFLTKEAITRNGLVREELWRTIAAFAGGENPLRGCLRVRGPKLPTSKAEGEKGLLPYAFVNHGLFQDPSSNRKRASFLCEPNHFREEDPQ